MKRLLTVLSLVLVIAVLAACAAPAAPAPAADGGDAAMGEADGLTICFAYQDLETEFWVAGHKAIVETLSGLGVNVIERNANEDANKQLEQVKDCIAQEVDGIIIIPQDGESAVTIVGEANKAGIPIGVFNRPPANDSNPTLVIVANNEVITAASCRAHGGRGQGAGPQGHAADHGRRPGRSQCRRPTPGLLQRRSRPTLISSTK